MPGKMYCHEGSERKDIHRHFVQFGTAGGTIEKKYCLLLVFISVSPDSS